MTPGDSQLGQSTIPNDMNSSRGNGDFWKERSPILMPVSARFFQSHPGFGGPNHSKKYFETRGCFRREHYGARYLKGFKTATSKCAKSRSFRVAMVRP